MADGVADISECGSILSIDLELEREVPATASRLAWMLKNVDRLVHSDGRLWGALRQRVADRVRVEEALASLAAEKVEIPRDLVLEGNTHADCLIDCEHVLIWIEGKRDDWLSQSTKWDVTRDQLARNVEAAWWIASQKQKDYRVLICHEHSLKHHELSLVEGYRRGTWSAGWPHISQEQRREFSTRVGTLTWTKIAEEWPAMRMLPNLADLQ